MNNVDEIEDAIRTAGVSIGAVERAAGMARQTLWRIRTGRRDLTACAAGRFRLAIKRVSRGDGDAEGHEAAAAYYLAIAYVARQFDVRPAEVLSSDPGRRATADPRWASAARARRWALYIANIYMGISQARLARAAGLSKAAVSMALNALEDDRDTAEVEALLADIEGAFAP
ncbi:MAG: hypothetical protein ABGW90_04010 [Martelella sp.]